jgi:DNA-binding transcriptional LysR family regulator
MDRLQAMQAFVRVAEAGSFSAVARQTGATQSVVSKQVAALKQALGARLLSRTTRSLALTDEGQRYFEQAQRLVAEIAEAEAVVRGASLQLSGTPSQGAPDPCLGCSACRMTPR